MLHETFVADPKQPRRIPGENLVEQLAFVEHERWSDWQKYLFSVCDENPNGSLTIPSFFVKKWQEQMRKPYTSLSESEKQSDREQVMRYFHLINRDPMRI